MASHSDHSSSVRASTKTYSKSAVRVISSKCAAWSCENNKKASSNVTYFQLPICDYGRCTVWLLNSGRIDLVGVPSDQLSGYVICSNHFEDSQLIHSSSSSRHLVENAIPTLFGSANAPISINLINCLPEGYDHTTAATTKDRKDLLISLKLSSARCCSCKNTYKKCPTITFFFFPIDDLSRLYSWIVNSGLTYLLQKSKEWVQQNHLVCSDHFEYSQFEDEDARDSLKPGAIPTIFDGLQPTIPAPKVFNRIIAAKPMPLILDKPKSEMSSPKLTIVNTVSLAGDSKRKKVPFKVSVPQVSLLNKKASPVVKTWPQKTVTKTFETPRKTIVPVNMQNKPVMASTKLVVKPIVTNPALKSISDVSSSTILIDSSGKPNSDHPLANVISMFLAQNKGHTGDLLITDGTPNGAKYLIRQNKIGSMKDLPTPNKSPKPPPPKVSPKQQALQNNLPAQSKVSSPLFVDLRSPSAAKSPAKNSLPPSPPKLVFLKPPATDNKAIVPKPLLKISKQNGVTTLQNSSKTPVTSKDTITMLVPVSTALTSNNSGSFGGTANMPAPSDSVTLLLPVAGPIVQNNIAPKIVGSPATPGASMPIRMVIPVTPSGPSSTVKPTLTVQKPISVAAATKQQSLLNQVTTPSPQTPKPAIKISQPVTILKKNTETPKENGISTSTSTPPFTIVKKNSEATKENGTTTCKSTFVIRGNGPLSSDQLEAIVRENLLKTGTIKDGAKILIRHKGAIPNNQGPEAVKNGTFMVRESKIVPMKPVATTKVSNTPKTPMTKLKAKTDIQYLNLDPLTKHLPQFRYPKGISPDKLVELRKSVRRHQVKISRQKKIIDKLKLEKKEKVKNLPSDQLIRLVRKSLPGFAGKFFEAQLQTSIRDAKKHGHRWDEDSKVFALGLWNRSPAAFKLMQRAFALPSLKTLSTWVAGVPPDVDFFEKLKEVLESNGEGSTKKDLENVPKEVVEEENGRPDEEIELEEELVQPISVEGGVGEREEGVGEGEEPQHLEEDEEAMFPDEEEQMDLGQGEGQELIEKVCIDLDAETGMHIVEEVVEDSDQALVENLIRVAQISSEH